jgi:hypothetical protein
LLSVYFPFETDRTPEYEAILLVVAAVSEAIPTVIELVSERRVANSLESGMRDLFPERIISNSPAFGQSTGFTQRVTESLEF